MKTSLILFVTLLALMPFAAFAQEELTYEQWETEVATAQKREQVAKEAIATEQSKITSLKDEIEAVKNQIASTRSEIYALLGITEEDVQAWNEKIDALVSKLEELASITPDELIKRISELKDSEKTLVVLKENKVSWLYASAARISEVESLIEQVKANLPDKPMAYTVRLIPEKRDCLWRIAGYEEIYNDPMQWPKLYQANKGQIKKGFKRYTNNSADAKYTKAEDLIFPGQVFDVPR